MSDATLLALDDLDFIEAAYFDVLGRPADPQGLQHALQSLRAGTPRSALLADWRGSREARLRQARLSGDTSAQQQLHTALAADATTCTLDDLLAAEPAAFVQLAYLRLLGRETDPAGAATYLQRLQGGAPRALLLDDIARSDEGRRFGAPLDGLTQAVADTRHWRSRLARWWQRQRGAAPQGSTSPVLRRGPARLSTLVLLVTRPGDGGPLQAAPERTPATAAAWGCDAARLDVDGQVRTTSGRVLPLRQLLQTSRARHVLLLDDRCTLLDDFWPRFDAADADTRPGTQAWWWPCLQADGTPPPADAPRPLLDPAFVGQPTLPLLAVLVDEASLLAMQASDPAAWQSGALCLEQALAAAPALRVAGLDTPLSRSDGLAQPAPRSSSMAPQGEPDLQPPPRPGLSVVLSCGKAVDDALLALDSLQGQAPAEVVLVRQAMEVPAFQALSRHARARFGHHAVQTADAETAADSTRHTGVPGRCTAARLARHEVLLLLDAHGRLPPAPALREACVVAQRPWVATVGFAKAADASGIGDTRAPPSQATQETTANDFEALVVRRSVALSLGLPDATDAAQAGAGLDFCRRARQQGLRHVRLGCPLVGHAATPAATAGATQRPVA